MVVVVFTLGLSRGDLEVEVDVGVVGEGVSKGVVVGARVTSTYTVKSA